MLTSASVDLKREGGGKDSIQVRKEDKFSPLYCYSLISRELGQLLQADESKSWCHSLRTATRKHSFLRGVKHCPGK